MSSSSFTSKKIMDKILSAHNVGQFTEEEASLRHMRCVHASAGSYLEGNVVSFFWLVDLEDGMIVDAKFQAFGPFSLLAAADAACELIIGKNYDQARRISSDLLDKSLQGKAEESAYQENLPYLDLVIEALVNGSEKCGDIPLSERYISPVPQNESDSSGYPGWLELSNERKLAVIEEVLNVDVRPYVELDEGGIEVQELKANGELIIAYKGNCTSCISSIGATLSTIQQILQTKVHPDIVVTPNMDALQL